MRKSFLLITLVLGMALVPSVAEAGRHNKAYRHRAPSVHRHRSHSFHSARRYSRNWGRAPWYRARFHRGYHHHHHWALHHWAHHHHGQGRRHHCR
jgi:hypothetical protein